MLALHFLSGGNRDQAYLIPEDGELLLGRTEDDDVVVNDSSAKHVHAAVTVVDNQVMLRDLGSGGSTLVNRKKIEEAVLKEDDRIKIGKVNCVVIAVTRYTKPKGSTQVNARHARAKIATIMTSSLEEKSAVDLLQFVCGGGKTGVATLTSDKGKGRVYILNGHISHVSTTPASEAGSKRLLFRLLRWKNGTFQFEECVLPKVPHDLDDPSDILLMEGAQEEMELFAIEAELPPLSKKLAVAKLAGADLKKLAPAELLFLGLVRTKGTVQAVLDGHPGGEVKACTMLADLLRRKVILAE